MSFSPQVQRAVLKAVMEGKLGADPLACPPELFSGEREEIARRILDFRKEFQHWPTVGVLEELLVDSLEVPRLGQVPAAEVEWAAKQHRSILQKRAYEQIALDVALLAEGDSPDFGPVLKWVREAAQVGSPEICTYSYGEGAAERHLYSHAVAKGYPTGWPTLEQVKPGGLWTGEVGAIMAGTKVGKTHFLIHLAAQALRGGHPVLLISLEMTSEHISRRLDRSLTGMTSDAIAAQPKGFEVALRESCPNPELVKVVNFPRRSVGPGMVRKLVEQFHGLGDKPLWVGVDYAQLLKGPGGDRHKEVGEVVSELSAIAQEWEVGIWSPWQLNRAGVKDGDGGLANAGESFEAMQHYDLILSVTQDAAMKSVNRATLYSAGSRESSSFEFEVETDWSRSIAREI